MISRQNAQLELHPNEESSLKTGRLLLGDVGPAGLPGRQLLLIDQPAQKRRPLIGRKHQVGDDPLLADEPNRLCDLQSLRFIRDLGNTRLELLGVPPGKAQLIQGILFSNLPLPGGGLGGDLGRIRRIDADPTGSVDPGPLPIPENFDRKRMLSFELRLCWDKPFVPDCSIQPKIDRFHRNRHIAGQISRRQVNASPDLGFLGSQNLGDPPPNVGMDLLCPEIAGFHPFHLQVIDQAPPVKRLL